LPPLCTYPHFKEEWGVPERGVSPSLITSPSQTNENRVLKIIRFERGFTLKVLPEGIKGGENL
jgi:hypothetical protein